LFSLYRYAGSKQTFQYSTKSEQLMRNRRSK